MSSMSVLISSPCLCLVSRIEIKWFNKHCLHCGLRIFVDLDSLSIIVWDSVPPLRVFTIERPNSTRSILLQSLCRSWLIISHNIRLIAPLHCECLPLYDQTLHLEVCFWNLFVELESLSIIVLVSVGPPCECLPLYDRTLQEVYFWNL